MVSSQRKKSEPGINLEAVPRPVVETSPIGRAKKRTRNGNIMKTADPDPQVKTNQKLKLKSKCFQCENKKWCIDFKEQSHNKITRKSICQFCELKNMIRKQNEEITALKHQLKQQEENSNNNYGETVKMLSDFQAEIEHLKHDIKENENRITSFEKEKNDY